MIFFSILDLTLYFVKLSINFFETIVLEMCDLIGIVINNIVVVCVCVCDFLFVMKVCYLVS